MLFQDLRYAFRTLIKRPGFAAVAILTLALGIGANTAVFSVVEGVLLRPLPVRDPDALVLVWEHNIRRGNTHNVVSPANYMAWRDRNRSFESIAAFVSWGTNLTGDGEPERVQGGQVTADFFATLGVWPRLGRGFTETEGKPDAPRAAVLADGFWKRRFGGDASAVGRVVTLDGQPTTIVGVMAPGFSLPPGVDLWITARIDERWRTSGGRYLVTVARLRPGVAVAAARAEMESIAAQLQEEEPNRNANWGVTVAPIHADLVRDVKSAVYVLAGAVALVLLIACGNLANLLLARAIGREREMAVRRALGASQGRLVAQLLAESLALSLVGAALGVALASVFVKALLGIVPAQVRAVFDVSLDLRVLAFTLVVSCLSAALFGLAPALSLVRAALSPSLREGSSGTGASRSRRRLSQALAASEIALSIVLLIGASLLLRSFARLSRVQPGFETTSTLTFELSLPSRSYAEPARVVRFYEDAIEALSRVPGVRAAGAISWRPLGSGSATRFKLFDRPVPPAGQEPTADIRILTPGTFRAIGVPLLLGRDFERADNATGLKAVIVNDRLAREFWPSQDPLGKRIAMNWGGDPEGEVVGVVGDVRLNSLDAEARPTLYWPQAQVPNNFMTLMLRFDGDPKRALPSVKAELAKLDKDIPVASVATLDELLGDSLRRPRFVMSLLGAFAVAAALLATIGLFGVLSCAVGQRTRELGVRLALGAQPSDLVRLLLGEGLLVAAIGLAAGAAIAAGGSRLLASLLFQTSPLDPVAFASTGGLLLAVSALAALVPALRAGRVDPARALHAE